MCAYRGRGLPTTVYRVNYLAVFLSELFLNGLVHVDKLNNNINSYQCNWFTP